MGASDDPHPKSSLGLMYQVIANDTLVPEHLTANARRARSSLMSPMDSDDSASSTQTGRRSAGRVHVENCPLSEQPAPGIAPM